MALEELPVYYAKRINGALLLLLLLISFQKLNAQSFDALIFGYKGKAYLSSIVGETVALVDSTVVKDDGVCILSLSNSNLHTGFYRVTFD